MPTLWDELKAEVSSRLGRQEQAWKPPVTCDFRSCKVIAFDPSLSSTGWVHLRVSPWRDSPFILIAKGTLRVRTTETGYRGTYDKASRMGALISEVIWAEQHYAHPSAIAWEAPAVHGHRLESSLIAGFLVYEASNRAGTVISANHASFLLTGTPAHDKGEIAEAVARYLAETTGRTWNQHERDALAIALAYSLDLPEPEGGIEHDEDIY